MRTIWQWKSGNDQGRLTKAGKGGGERAKNFWVNGKWGGKAKSRKTEWKNDIKELSLARGKGAICERKKWKSSGRESKEPRQRAKEFRSEDSPEGESNQRRGEKSLSIKCHSRGIRRKVLRPKSTKESVLKSRNRAEKEKLGDFDARSERSILPGKPAGKNWKSVSVAGCNAKEEVPRERKAGAVFTDLIEKRRPLQFVLAWGRQLVDRKEKQKELKQKTRATLKKK